MVSVLVHRHVSVYTCMHFYVIVSVSGCISSSSVFLSVKVCEWYVYISMCVNCVYIFVYMSDV